MGINQPQLPAARSIDAAENGGMAGQRSLRNQDDTYGKYGLNGAEADGEERGMEFLRKFSPVTWAKMKINNHKLRKAARLAANERKFKEDMGLLEMLEKTFYKNWRENKYDEAAQKADLIAHQVPENTFADVLKWYTPYKESS
ncbi:hypothetical protein ON010_g16421 [Phytophthora cinnamomi]|nr:hypothetical protein ON010_g16421 [Phytophthora cinnamomi]